MRLNSTINYLNQWGDTEALGKIKKSNNSKELMRVNCENTLKDIAMRFQHSPNTNTLSLWAKDIVDAGFTDDHLNLISKSIPFKFERHPTLAQVMELLRPNIAKEASSLDELTDLTYRCRPHLKAKFMAVSDQETLTKMVEYYCKHVFKELAHFSIEHQESCVLGDWLRSYFKKGEDIIAQGLKSNEAHGRGDYEYFTRSLRLYAKEHKL